VARETAAYLASLKQIYGLDDRAALIHWARHAQLYGWEQDPIGSISGVGINTYQYLRMMGGVDTVMPDKIVKESDLRVFSTKPASRARRPISISFCCWKSWRPAPDTALSSSAG